MIIKSIVFLISWIVVASCCMGTSLIHAQTIMRGKVLCYNGSEKKTALKGVEISVTGASSTVSDINGQFRLSFPIKRKGDRAEVRKIRKNGYVIFNTDAIEQWIIGDSFTVVMCDAARFKAIRDRYFTVSSESYRRQHEAEKARITKMKAANKSRAAYYEAQLDSIEKDYRQRLRNLDYYVDRFARIDLSELSEEEQRIISLVNEGKLDQAISRYEEMNLIGKYEDIVKVLDNINSALDEINQLTTEKENSIQRLEYLTGLIVNLYNKNDIDSQTVSGIIDKLQDAMTRRPGIVEVEASYDRLSKLNRNEQNP